MCAQNITPPGAKSSGRPLVITVSGACSGVGKTRAIERLLPVLRSATAVKVRTEEARPATRYEETSPEQHADKDTGRYLTAGARRAFLLSGARADVLAMAQEVLSAAGTEVVLFETDSLSAALAPDLAVFVAGDGPWKPGAEERCGRADIVVTGAPSALGRAASGRAPEPAMPEDAGVALAEAVLAQAQEGRIACGQAFALARRLGVAPRDVGDACNRAGVKIVQCQLGCFK